MLKLLQEIFKTGNATVKYPFAPLKVVKDARGKPEHDVQQCIACSACATACPANAIQMHIDSKAGTITWEFNCGRCIFCGRCEEVCPTEAIKLGPEFELAVMSKDDLREECVYLLQACESCGKYYAPRKEIDYARKILALQKGNDQIDAALDGVAMCPDCRRLHDAVAAQRSVDVQGGNHA